MIFLLTLSSPPLFFETVSTYWQFQGGWWARQERGGWGMKRKQSGATLTARWGNQKTRGNQKYYTWQSKDSPPATAGNQKHPWAIKEPFSAIALHTQTVRGKKTKKDMLWRFISHLKIPLPLVLVEDQPTLHPCYLVHQTRPHCGRLVIEQIHHTALSSSSAEGGEKPLITGVEYGKECWD